MNSSKNQCPAWDQFVIPVLKLALTQPITRRLACEQIPELLGLSSEVLEQRLNSGARRVDNRIGWAMTHLTKAGLIEKVKRATYGLTEQGREFYDKHSNKEITYHELEELEGYKEAWEAAATNRREGGKNKSLRTSSPSREVEASTPDELIDSAYNDLNQSLSEELLETMHDMDPYKFEQLVVDLLFAMGYGGSRTEAAQVTQKSNDEGIDGVINEDRLGLDVVYIQAKRYQASSSIGRKEIQSFVGALAGKQANKGVFITTSDFTSTATDFAANISQKVILINGVRLANLMIEHDIGVSTIRTISLKRLDSDYFDG